LKIYISKVEGLLLNNPAAYLHKDQKLAVEIDTVDVLTAVAEGKLELVLPSVSAPVIPSEPPAQADVDVPMDKPKHGITKLLKSKLKQ
jgi:hypothetical protein